MFNGGYLWGKKTGRLIWVSECEGRMLSFMPHNSMLFILIT